MSRKLPLAVLAVALAGCGGDEPAKPAAAAKAKPVGKASQGSVVQYADCGDWKRGTRAEKQATVVELRGQLTPQSSETAASDLSDERAFEIFEKTCDFNESLRLYKLYVRAQAFAPLAGS